MNTPDSKPKETPEAFLSRWSQRKQQARQEVQVPVSAPPATAPAQEAPPVLPPVEQLNADSDYRGFLHPRVDEGLRRAALKKLFSDPHFNVMDGLDTYIDDYSISEPIPEAMLAQMRHAQSILAHSKERRETEAARVAAEESAALAGADAPAASPALPAPVTDADAGTTAVVAPHDGKQAA